MNRKYIVLLLIIILLLVALFSGCQNNDTTVTTTATTMTTEQGDYVDVDNEYETTTDYLTENTTRYFSNAYGTANTLCVVAGCDNYIASTGDTNCCVMHSNKCLECGKYIDGDAMYCISCLSKAANSAYGY